MRAWLVVLVACSSAPPPRAAPPPSAAPPPRAAPPSRRITQLDVSAHHGKPCSADRECSPDAACFEGHVCRQLCDPDKNVCAGDGHAASRMCEQVGSAGLCELPGAGE